MQSMTSIERVSNQLRRLPVDRIAVYESFWEDTRREWIRTGQLHSEDHLVDVFDLDINEFWAFDYTADLDFTPRVIEETEETITTLNGNYATLRQHKLHASTPEHIDFMLKDRSLWFDRVKPLLTPDPRRIKFEQYRAARAHARAHNRFFFWSGINSFECMHPICGHEYMLMGMALDPEWVLDMAMTYARLNVALQEILFAQEGVPDGIWYYEDMGFKQRPFFSPAMYDELLYPAHKYTIDYAKSLNLPVVMHSCGFVESLIPGMIRAGIDCLQVIEIKAGMDLVKLSRVFGDHLSLMGGIDVRALYTNDLSQIEAELQSKLPLVMPTNGYMLHSDHSIPNTVHFDTYNWFVQRGREIGTYT